MAKTKTQVATLALQMLKAVEGDASPDTNDLILAEDAYDLIWSQLHSKRLTTWGSTASVPNECVNAVVALVAESRLPFFFVPPDVQQMVMLYASRAIGDITEFTSLNYVPRETPIEAF